MGADCLVNSFLFGGPTHIEVVYESCYAGYKIFVKTAPLTDVACALQNSQPASQPEVGGRGLAGSLLSHTATGM